MDCTSVGPSRTLGMLWKLDLVFWQSHLEVGAFFKVFCIILRVLSFGFSSDLEIYALLYHYLYKSIISQPSNIFPCLFLQVYKRFSFLDQIVGLWKSWAHWFIPNDFIFLGFSSINLGLSFIIKPFCTLAFKEGGLYKTSVEDSSYQGHLKRFFQACVNFTCISLSCLVLTLSISPSTINQV